MLSRCKETIKTNKEKYTQISTEKDQLNKQLLEKNNELEKVKVSVVSLTVYAKLVHRQPDQISIFFLFGDLKSPNFMMEQRHIFQRFPRSVYISFSLQYDF